MIEENVTHSAKPKNSLPQIRTFDGQDWFNTKTYRRNLPHWELQGSTYFITVRVNSDVRNPQLAKIMAKIFYQYHEKMYLLYAYVIMPDHLHFILKPILENSLAKILQTLKGSSSYQMNKFLKRTGKFWQAENFDHLIRDGKGLRDKWEYIKENPVKAGLVNKSEKYPHSSFYLPELGKS